MFNDRYGLTQAVFEGRKTMTRRLVPWALTEQWMEFVSDAPSVGGVYVHESEKEFYEREAPRYKVGEVVAVAQSYKSCGNYHVPKEHAGWGNKLFVNPALMPYRIRITGIKCERLQDISDAECMKEGVVGGIIGYYVPGIKCKDWSKESYVDTEDGRTWKLFPTPREAFASLIDKVSGRGTWGQNPWVVAYEFELRKGQKKYARKVWRGGTREYGSHMKLTECDFIAGAQSDEEARLGGPVRRQDLQSNDCHKDAMQT